MFAFPIRVLLLSTEDLLLNADRLEDRVLDLRIVHLPFESLELLVVIP
jgi:hypothetical protein